MKPIQKYFSEIPDFRISKKCKHKLSDILLIALFTYLSNGEDYEDMILFAKKHGTSLSEYLSLPKGIPSHDTFNRVFQSLDCEILREILSDYGREILNILSEKQICIDGKKLKGVNPTSKGNKGLYILNAWVGENKICVGQTKVEDKSNEITAIPELLKNIDITDAIVSIDAIGCQKKVVEQIISQKGNYILSVKKNQKKLFEDIEFAFTCHKPISKVQEWEYERSRFETRKCSILSAENVLLPEICSQWTNLKTIIKVDSKRIINDIETLQTRYYMSNEQETKAKYFNSLVRGHWGIENHLHWHLDVTFKEDNCRVRTKNAPENLATIRKFALQIITEYKGKEKNLSLKKRRVKAAYDIDFLKDLIS